MRWCIVILKHFSATVHVNLLLAHQTRRTLFICRNVLCKELTFIVATALLNNIEQLKNIQNIYPKHLEHQYSAQAGLKTHQIPLGLFDCNEQKTQDVIKLLKEFSQKYVPVKDGEIVEEVFLGGQ